MSSFSLETHAPADLAPRDSAKRVIGRWLRRAIYDGHFAVDARVPSAESLAARFNTSTFTVHQAMESLVADGLLERRRRVGTFVRDDRVRLRAAGVYYGVDPLSDPSTRFAQTLNEHLKRQLAVRGADIRLWYAPAEGVRGGAMPPAMAESVAARSVQCVFSPAADRDWLHGLEIPKALITSNPCPYQVDFDRADFVALGLEALARGGVRRAGVVAAVTAPEDGGGPGRDAPPGVRPPGRVFFDALDAAASRFGLAIPPAWRVGMPTVARESGGRAERVRAFDDYAAFGYDAVQRLHAAGLWRADADDGGPAGLLVFPDAAATGAIMALTQLGVAAASRTRAAFHRNRGTDLFAPFPYTAVESDPEEAAKALLAQVDRQFLDEAPSPIILKHTFAAFQ